jgi:hypothetical protein
MFSSIEKESRQLVIEKCYWPLFKLIDLGIPIAIESTGKTLEIINDLDSEWVLKLKQYLKMGQVEFIGSGYSQIIGPLVPARLNDWNQKLGRRKYLELLNVKPKIALVNEMAYSAGIVEHYLNHQYEGLIMEWNNPRKYHPEWNENLKYFPQKVIGSNNRTITIIWAETIAFQKFQRYAHGEYSMDKYLKFIKTKNSKLDRYFPMYSNDVEIFDYRPSRYHNEAKIKASEFESIFKLYKKMKEETWLNFIFPSRLLKLNKTKYSQNKISLETPEQPIPVKKQEKYNINRWALSGKNDLVINTTCFKIYKNLLNNSNSNSNDWTELCYLWSSDFRTHITDKRWLKYKKRLEDFNHHHNEHKLSKIKGENISLRFKSDIVRTNYKRKNGSTIVKNKNIELYLNKKKGLTINKCIFKRLSKKSLFGTLEHGYFQDISFAEDYFSGNSIIERLGQHMISDIDEISPKIFNNGNQIIIESTQAMDTYWGNIRGDGNIKFDSKIILNQDSLKFKKRITFGDDLWWRTFLGMAVVRPFILTFNPEAWDINTLFYKAHNGGESPEIYHPEGKTFNHGIIYSSLISSKHGLGITEGEMIVGDKDKELTIKCDMTKSALIPSIIFYTFKNLFFFRIQYSAKEIDETVSKQNNLKEIELDFVIN